MDSATMAPVPSLQVVANQGVDATGNVDAAAQLHTQRIAALTVKVDASIAETDIAASDSWVKSLVEWRDGLTTCAVGRIGVPPKPRKVLDTVLLERRDAIYKPVYELWKDGDEQRKSAERQTLDARRNAARGKQPSGAANKQT